MADHFPAIPLEVPFQLLQFYGQTGSQGVVHEQNDRSSLIDRRQFNATRYVAVSGPLGGAPHELVLVKHPDRDRIVRVLGGASPHGSMDASPAGSTLQPAIDRQVVRARKGCPADGYGRRIILDHGLELHGVPDRGTLCDQGCRYHRQGNDQNGSNGLHAVRFAGWKVPPAATSRPRTR